MTELILPNSIDAGTEIVAAEHQQNYEAIRDVINGQLEGGSGASGNLKANGVTARELADLIMTMGLPPAGSREGLVTQPSGVTQALYVSPGAGLNLNYGAGTAWVRDDSGVIATGALIPVVVTSGSVAVPSNSSGNPRLDQIILTMTGYGTGTVSVLQGTPNAATTLNNRTGAASLPNDAIRLADVLTTNGFAGPYVDHTSLRNRIPWAVPMKFAVSAVATLDFVVDSQVSEIVDFTWDIETSGFTNLNFQMEGSSSAVYSTIADEVQVLSTAAQSRNLRGSTAATSAAVAFPGNAAAAGGMKTNGRGTWSFRPVSSNWYTFTGDSAVSSLTGSGNHVLSDAHIAATFAPGSGGIVSWVHLFVATGTLTGNFIIDRVPMA